MIIGLCGAARSGKDTVGQMLKKYGFRRIAYADPIKHMTMAFTGLDYDTLDELKDENLDWLGISPRILMQTLGTEWGREIIGESVWLKLAANRMNTLKKLGWENFVFTDVRFANEAEQIHSFGGEVVRIERPGIDSVAPHASEGGIPDELVDHILPNTHNLRYLGGGVRNYLESRGFPL